MTSTKTPSYVAEATSTLAEAEQAEAGARGLAVRAYAKVGLIYLAALNAVLAAAGEAVVTTADVTTSRVLAVLAASARGEAEAAKATKVSHDDRTATAEAATFGTVNYATLDQCVRATKVTEQAVILAEAEGTSITRAREAINLAASMSSDKADDATKAVRNAVTKVSKAKTEATKATAREALTKAMAERDTAKAEATKTKADTAKTKATTEATTAKVAMLTLLAGDPVSPFVGPITVGQARGLTAEQATKAAAMFATLAVILTEQAEADAKAKAEAAAAGVTEADDAKAKADLAEAIAKLAEQGVPEATIARLREEAGLTEATA